MVLQLLCVLHLRLLCSRVRVLHHQMQVASRERLRVADDAYRVTHVHCSRNLVEVIACGRAGAGMSRRAKQGQPCRRQSGVASRVNAIKPDTNSVVVRSPVSPAGQTVALIDHVEHMVHLC